MGAILTPDIALVLAILAVAVFLFISEIIRMDLTALIVLVALFFTGLVEPAQALSGFSNPAVIAVGGMFVLSVGLTRTGVSSLIGAQVLRLARQGEARLVAVLMTATALLSSFMNNTAVATMFLPITLEISKRTRQAPSRLLLPMAYSSLVDEEFEIYGQRVNAATGELILRQFLISRGVDGNTAYGGSLPAVAYNSQSNEYLVMWYGDDNTGSLVDGEYEIFGQRLGTNGAEVGDNDFRLSDMGPDGNTAYGASYPAVAYSSADNVYLVVRQGDDNTGPLVWWMRSSKSLVGSSRRPCASIYR